MKRMIISIALAAIVTLAAVSVSAQASIASRLKADVVEIYNGKYTATDYYYLVIDYGTTAQMKVTANCPVDVMSRDNFVSIYSSYSVILLISMFIEAGYDIPDIQEMDELIGDPDITIKMVMAKNGMQIQVISTEGQENMTMTWTDILGE